MNFEWDQRKAESNLRKHGVSFHKGASVLADSLSITYDDLRPEYDFSTLKGGVRGKYAQQFRDGTNLVRLSPNVAAYFPTEESVNSALRSLVEIASAKLNHVH